MLEQSLRQAFAQGVPRLVEQHLGAAQRCQLGACTTPRQRISPARTEDVLVTYERQGGALHHAAIYRVRCIPAAHPRAELDGKLSQPAVQKLHEIVQQSEN